MRSSLISLLTILLSLTMFADNDKVIKLKKNNIGIDIDGLIDSEWSIVDSISDFVQYQPYNGKEPTRKTIAKVLTTDDALYCLMICYDDKTNIEQNAGTLDNFTGDIVSIMLDTFGDKSIQYDEKLAEWGLDFDRYRPVVS
ncbi:MAG: hypothetical protein HY800_06505 [Ignavibacteriales bacterium]|nr:hypothetical protein [Ignavibacteriales bacterium]